MSTLEQASVETYIHEFASLPHPGDFGIPKGHWWQAKAYADQLCASTPAPQAVMEQQPKQKPVAWWNPRKDTVSCDPVHRHHPDCTPLYTAPPQREWVGLTDEEIDDFMEEAYQKVKKQWIGRELEYYFARSIEANLKELNT